MHQIIQNRAIGFIITLAGINQWLEAVAQRTQFFNLLLNFLQMRSGYGLDVSARPFPIFIEPQKGSAIINIKAQTNTCCTSHLKAGKPSF